MTAKKNFKRIVRQRMLRTGESYTAARRHFLDSKDLTMTERMNCQESSLMEQPIEQLQFTLETTRILKARGVKRVEDLINARSNETNPFSLDPKRAIEVREVLASRGL